MHSWDTHVVPALEPSGIFPQFFDTRTGSLQTFTPHDSQVARIYVCGITPYDSTHMGHAMTYHTADLMRRIVADSGVETLFAQNVTDVDDPLFERAGRDNVDWQWLAEEQTNLFRSDMQALRVLPPTHFESVSEAMPRIIAMVHALRTRAIAYPVSNPDGSCDWYHDLSQAPGYGAAEAMGREQAVVTFGERGGDPERPGKRDALDPLLWKAERPGEPAWDGGELGRGRPGWHVECVAIAQEGLGGLPIDLQIGGNDLVFPHHEGSHAHAVGLGHREFASLYSHVGMVAYEGEKMSKSLGNLVFVSRLTAEGTDPRAIRLALMAHHYREGWEWTSELLDEAKRRLHKYKAASKGSADDSAQVELVREALRNDLDTSAVLRVLDEWAAAGGGRFIPRALDALTGIKL